MPEQIFLSERIPLGESFPEGATGSVASLLGVDHVQQCNADLELCVVKAVDTDAKLDAVAADPRVLAIPRGNLKRRIDGLPPNQVAQAQLWIDNHGLATEITDHATLRQAANALATELGGLGFDLKSLGIRGGSVTRAQGGGGKP